MARKNLIIKKAKNRKENSAVIRIGKKEYDVLQRISKESNRPVGEIANMMIDYSIDGVRIEGEEDTCYRIVKEKKGKGA